MGMNYRIIGLNDEKDIKESVICLGNFDGVHIGHQLLISTATSLAKEHQLISIFFTIFPSPKSILGKRTEKYLTDLDDRYKLAKSFGIDEMIVLPFNLEMAKYPYDDFVHNIILKYKPRYIVCGEDFNFGYKGEGKIKELKHLGKGIYEVVVVPDVMLNNEKISTTKIIEALQKRDIEKVATFLGRNYKLSGTVVKGSGNGKNFGFPTANLDTNNYFLPGNGVYAVNIYFNNQKYRGMANVGLHPTVVKLNDVILEVHIFDFDKNIYGEKIEVEFCQFIRLERHFSSLEQLISQLHKDTAFIKALIF